MALRSSSPSSNDQAARAESKTALVLESDAGNGFTRVATAPVNPFFVFESTRKPLPLVGQRLYRRSDMTRTLALDVFNVLPLIAQLID